MSRAPRARRVRRRVPSASSRARRTATSRRIAGCTSSSTRPICSAFFARMFLPVRIMSSAAASPTRRGRRCVPPAPGMSPSCTSGSASTVFGLSVAMRYANAIADSSPPPTHAPLIAATIGLPRSRRSIIACPSRDRRSASVAVRSATSSSMSAPAMKLSGLPLIITTARTLSSFSSRSMSAPNSSRTARVKVFTGAPGTSKVTTATPSCISVVRAYGDAPVTSAPRPSRGPSRRRRIPSSGRTGCPGASSRSAAWSGCAPLWHRMDARWRATRP